MPWMRSQRSTRQRLKSRRSCSGGSRGHTCALLRRDDQVTVVLDIAQLLNSRERMVLDQAMVEAAHG